MPYERLHQHCLVAAAALLLASSCANDAEDPATTSASTTAADTGSQSSGTEAPDTTGTSSGDAGLPMGAPCQSDNQCMEALFCDMHGGDSGVCDGPHGHEPDCDADPAACGLGSSSTGSTTAETDSETDSGSTTGTGSTGTGSTG